jgi:hypothetical protein
VTAHTLAVALLACLAVTQTAWFVAYGTGPWRDTRLGWVWLLKGGVIGVVWWTWLADETVHNVPDALWLAEAVAMLAATAVWLVATIRARRGWLS